MKFDVIVGNPPYGKNSNLAVNFLNKASELSDTIWFVLPRTFRKASIQNRIQENLHLAQDVTVPDNMFPASIITCYQNWIKTTAARSKIETITQHPDLQFVNKQTANVCVGRVGAGPCGKVFVKDFDDKSENSHYFIKAKNKKVIQSLIQLTDQFKLAGTQTVGVPSLSKHELITIYQEHVI